MTRRGPEPPGPDSLDVALADWARRRAARNPGLAPAVRLVRSWVGAALRDAPLDGVRRRLTDEALAGIATTIDRHYASAEGRLRARTLVNDLLWTLRQRGLAISSYLNVPSRPPRRLLAAPGLSDMPALGPLLALKGRLEARAAPGPPPGWRFSPGLWEYVLLVLSLVLSSRALIRRLPERLLALTSEHLAGRWLRVPPLPTAGRMRSAAPVAIPLAPATQRHLARLLARVSPRRRGRPRRGAALFPDRWRSLAIPEFPAAWRVALDHLLSEVPEPFRPRSFAAVTRLARLCTLLRNDPPFVLAAVAGEIPVNPASAASLRRALGERVPAPAAAPRPGSPHRRRPDEAPLLFDRIERLRLGLGRSAARETLAASAAALRDALGPPLPPRAAAADPAAYNVRCYGLWILARLLHAARRGRPRPGTVNTRASAIGAHFFPTFAEIPFTAWTSADWGRALATIMAEHRSPHARIALRQFHDFLVERGLAPAARVPWHRTSPDTSRGTHAYPLITFADFERALRMPCPREISAGLYRLLRAKMILGFGLGLRSAEATRLPVSALSGPEPVLRVRRGKTPYADRNLYLRYLLLPEHLDELLAFADARRRAVADPDAEPLLATSAHPRGYDSSYLASLCSRLLQPAVGEAVCFHHLRHAFASWFLVRALVAVGVVPLPTDLPFASSPAFTPEALERLRILLFGFGPPWEGRATVSHAVVALAFLLGHSNPETTLTTYWHSAEIILALLQGRCDEQPSTGV